MPKRAEHRQALEAYFQAVANLARRREIIEQARASITEAEHQVQDLHAQCVDLGLLPKPGRRTTSPSSTRAPGAPTQIERAVAAVRAGATSIGEVMRAEGWSSAQAGVVLKQAVDRGLLARVKVAGQFVYSLPAEASTEAP